MASFRRMQKKSTFAGASMSWLSTSACALWQAGTRVVSDLTTDVRKQVTTELKAIIDVIEPAADEAGDKKRKSGSGSTAEVKKRQRKNTTESNKTRPTDSADGSSSTPGNSGEKNADATVRRVSCNRSSSVTSSLSSSRRSAAIRRGEEEALRPDAAPSSIAAVVVSSDHTAGDSPATTVATTLRSQEQASRAAASSIQEVPGCGNMRASLKKPPPRACKSSPASGVVNGSSSSSRSATTAAAATGAQREASNSITPPSSNQRCSDEERKGKAFITVSGTVRLGEHHRLEIGMDTSQKTLRCFGKVDPKSGRVVQYFRTKCEAAATMNSTNLGRNADILEEAANRENMLFAGFFWKRVPISEVPVEELTALKLMGKSICVAKLDPRTRQVLAVYLSVRAAARAVNDVNGQGSLIRAADKNVPYMGFIWKRVTSIERDKGSARHNVNGAPKAAAGSATRRQVSPAIRSPDRDKRSSGRDVNGAPKTATGSAARQQASPAISSPDRDTDVYPSSGSSRMCIGKVDPDSGRIIEYFRTKCEASVSVGGSKNSRQTRLLEMAAKAENVLFRDYLWKKVPMDQVPMEALSSLKRARSICVVKLHPETRETIQVFLSARSAARSLGDENQATKILKAAFSNGKKRFQGFLWKRDAGEFVRGGDEEASTDEDSDEDEEKDASEESSTPVVVSDRRPSSADSFVGCSTDAHSGGKVGGPSGKLICYAKVDPYTGRVIEYFRSKSSAAASVNITLWSGVKKLEKAAKDEVTLFEDYFWKRIPISQVPIKALPSLSPYKAACVAKLDPVTRETLAIFLSARDASKSCGDANQAQNVLIAADRGDKLFKGFLWKRLDPRRDATSDEDEEEEPSEKEEEEGDDDDEVEEEEEVDEQAAPTIVDDQQRISAAAAATDSSATCLVKKRLYSRHSKTNARRNIRRISQQENGNGSAKRPATDIESQTAQKKQRQHDLDSTPATQREDDCTDAEDTRNQGDIGIVACKVADCVNQVQCKGGCSHHFGKFRSIPIAKLDPATRTVLAVYPSVRAAAKAINVLSPNCQLCNAAADENTIFGGFLWKRVASDVRLKSDDDTHERRQDIAATETVRRIRAGEAQRVEGAPLPEPAVRLECTDEDRGSTDRPRVEADSRMSEVQDETCQTEGDTTSPPAQGLDVRQKCGEDLEEQGSMPTPAIEADVRAAEGRADENRQIDEAALSPPSGTSHLGPECDKDVKQKGARRPRTGATDSQVSLVRADEARQTEGSTSPPTEELDARLQSDKDDEEKQGSMHSAADEEPEIFHV